MIIERPEYLISCVYWSGDYCAVGWLAYQLTDYRLGKKYNHGKELQIVLEVNKADLVKLVSTNDAARSSNERIANLEDWLKGHGHELAMGESDGQG